MLLCLYEQKSSLLKAQPNRGRIYKLGLPGIHTGTYCLLLYPAAATVLNILLPLIFSCQNIPRLPSLLEANVSSRHRSNSALRKTFAAHLGCG